MKTIILLGLRGTVCYEPSAPSKAASIYPLMRVADDLHSRSYATSEHGEAGNCRELMQCTTDVADPKAKSAGAVQWAHSSLSRIPRIPRLMVQVVRHSFPVGLFHSRLHAGLSRRSDTRRWPRWLAVKRATGVEFPHNEVGNGLIAR